MMKSIDDNSRHDMRLAYRQVLESYLSNIRVERGQIMLKQIVKSVADDRHGRYLPKKLIGAILKPVEGK